MKCAQRWVVLFALIFCASSARAAEPDREAWTTLPAVTPTQAAPASPSSRTWYGWQTLFADAGATVLFYATAEPLGGYALVPYFTFAPAVHLANGRVGAAFGSAGLRVGMPFVGALVGLGIGTVANSCSTISSSNTEPETDDGYGPGPAYACGVKAVFVGAFVGVLGAMVIDSTLLAWKHDPPAESGRATFRLAPSVAFDGKRASVGVLGAF